MKKAEKFPSCAVILAGGRGTRFWPRSRKRTPKQLLDFVSAKTMLRETAERLSPLFSPRQIWVVTNEEQAEAVRRELPRVPREQILVEPVGRNTAAAIGLAATHFARTQGDAVMAVLPADHYIADAARYRKIVMAAMELARRQGNLIVLGIPPTHPETGFGYIERAKTAERFGGFPAFAVKRFTEKPALAVARRYMAAHRYFWNAGMFFWRVSTYLECLRKFLPETCRALGELQQHVGMPSYGQALKRIYPKLENISVDYAVMERATRKQGPQRVYVLPAKVGWSDIGSWAAVYELLAAKKGANVSTGEHFAHDASGNFFWSPKKFVAAIGVNDLVLVETEDALLICHRERAQDVGKVVKFLEQKKKHRLL